MPTEEVLTKDRETEKDVDPSEVLEPTDEVKQVTIGKDENAYVFVQRPLSFFGKLDFFSVMGKGLDQAMKGPDGLSIAELWEMPSTGRDALNASDLRDADMFVKGIVKLAMYAPELMSDLYCVILSVPRGYRPVVKELMQAPEDEGGLSDEQGIAILETFIDQNWEVMVDFFKQRIAGLVEKVGQKTGSGSQSSKRSKSTRATTRKQSKS